MIEISKVIVEESRKEASGETIDWYKISDQSIHLIMMGQALSCTEFVCIYIEIKNKQKYILMC